jgi:glycosyltransferase involved in cell wall biosynthesis
MRIAQIVPSLEERHGGPSKSVYDMSMALARAGHDVELLATGPGPDEVRTDGRLKIEIFHRDWPQDICPSRGLRARLRRLDADVIQHHSLWLRTLNYAHRCATRTGARLVVSPRGMMTAWAWRHHRWRKQLARRVIHPGALEAVQGWHATSPEELADISARGFHQPMCMAPNGVAPPTAESNADAALHWRELCPATARRPVALFYSRFHRKKRVLELIDLWIEHGPRDWLLLLVGIPEDYDPASLEAYVLRSLGAGRVRAFSGIDQPPPYAVASLFLLPSHTENFGLAIAEALAHGVPALVTDTTPWSVLNDIGAGWCVPWSGYADALRAAVAEGPEKLRARGAVAREWVLREYSWDAPVRALVGFYEKLRGSAASDQRP